MPNLFLFNLVTINFIADWPQIILVIVAMYGAILSTYNLIIKLNENRKDIKVSISVGLLSYSDKLGDAQLFLVSKNQGKIPVNLNSPVIKLPNDKQIILMEPESNVKFPYLLNPESNCTVWTDLKRLAKNLKEEGFSGKVKLRGEFRDAVGKRHISNPMKIDVDAWGKEK